MATRTIATTIALDGEQQFKQALASATREMRVLESEAKALSAAYDGNSNSAAAYAARQQNLRSQIQQQTQIVQALERAVEDSAKTYGEASAQTDGWAIRLNNARTRLSRLQKELEGTDREAEELGRDSIKVGRQIQQGIGEGAREAEDSVNDLFETMQRDISSIRTSGVFTAVESIWNMASNAYNSVEGFVSGTIDYRRQLSMLLYNSQNTTFGTVDVEKNLIEVTGMVNDTSAAVEGLSNLMQIGFPDESRFSKAMKALLGASVKWPETMKFENLAESLQETLATGQAVGQYGELLERLGVNIDDFNKAMKESKNTQYGDIDLALTYLESNELIKAYEEYRKNNAQLVREMEAIARLEYQSARIGQVLANNIFTPMKEAGADAFDWLADVLETWETDGFGAAADKVIKDYAEAKKKAADVVEDAINDVYETMPDGVKKGVELLLPVMKEFAEMTSDPVAYGQKMGQEIQTEHASGHKDRQIELISSLLTGRYYGEMPAELVGPDGETYDVIGAGKDIDSVVEELQKKSESYKEAGAEAADAYLNGFETEVDMSTWESKPAEQLVTIPTADMEEAGEEAGQSMTEGFDEGVDGLTSSAETLGVATGAAFAKGLASQVSSVSAASDAIAAAAARGLAAMANLKSGSTKFGIYLDGRQVGEGVAPYSSEFMASSLTYDVFIN